MDGAFLFFGGGEELLVAGRAYVGKRGSLGLCMGKRAIITGFFMVGTLGALVFRLKRPKHSDSHTVPAFYFEAG